MKKDQKIRIVERMVACTTTDTIGSCGCRMYAVSGYMSGITCPLNINFRGRKCWLAGQPPSLGPLATWTSLSLLDNAETTGECYYRTGQLYVTYQWFSMYYFDLRGFPWLWAGTYNFLKEAQSEQNDRSKTFSPSRLAGHVFCPFQPNFKCHEGLGRWFWGWSSKLSIPALLYDLTRRWAMAWILELLLEPEAHGSWYLPHLSQTSVWSIDRPIIDLY